MTNRPQTVANVLWRYLNAEKKRKLGRRALHLVY
ncbi:hypothetical protein cd3_028 [Carnobacterium phage cd3]|uniref:Uncharacterized protein n=2 Tax=Carnodivirus TaxID=3044682 RepID=A0AAE7SQ34_9CAUD|nr:hypothetical protein PQD68_gp028 [Carnobacterium phage cd2]YP_010676494.1 hypothetical protein PQD69_gp028 [Carnobacterium phage cd4]QXP45154.1 hypothetical protein cd2_028 [Carnobacterium phage cd2]QXP45290.1 hypothetical protein cd3_028 [Carnobacterium phage cd3]QXP45373.1 hypothetical protein cd4_028 [Carnobacterium phage cd4]